MTPSAISARSSAAQAVLIGACGRDELPVARFAQDRAIRFLVQTMKNVLNEVHCENKSCHRATETQREERGQRANRLIPLFRSLELKLISSPTFFPVTLR